MNKNWLGERKKEEAKELLGSQSSSQETGTHSQSGRDGPPGMADGRPSLPPMEGWGAGGAVPGSSAQLFSVSKYFSLSKDKHHCGITFQFYNQEGFFSKWMIFKVFSEFVTILFLFMFWGVLFLTTRYVGS